MIGQCHTIIVSSGLYTYIDNCPPKFHGCDCASVLRPKIEAETYNKSSNGSSLQTTNTEMHVILD